MRVPPLSAAKDAAPPVVHPSIHPWTGEAGQQVEQEMLAILGSPAFHSSRRSCEFLRHIVERALQGRAHLLKERAIGIEVLGRKASSNIGSDGAVRVRANDVRRRLGSYYEQNRSQSGLRIELPPGSYVPQFVLASAEEETAPTEAVAAREEVVGEESTTEKLELVRRPPLVTLQRLAAALVVLLVVGAMATRYELAESTPFQSFWREVLKGRSQMTVVVERFGNQSNAVDLEEVQASLPLLELARTFHVPSKIENAVEGNGPRGSVVIRVTASYSGGDQRLHGRQHAAIITLLRRRGEPVVLSITATDAPALRRAIEVLTQPDAFPAELAGVTQVLLDAQGRAIQLP